MLRDIPTVVILTLLFLLGHALGSTFSLYEGIFGFDMVMHALGGAWLAAVFIVVKWFPYRTMFHVIGLVLLAGLAWELYEYGFAVWATATYGDLGFHQPWTDTASDLVLDTLGAALTSLFLLPKERKVS